MTHFRFIQHITPARCHTSEPPTTDASRFRPPRRPLFVSVAFVALIALAFALSTSHRAFAADTTEVFDHGALDVDYYLGAEGLGGADKGLFADIFIGYGLTKRISLNTGVTFLGPFDLQDAATEFYGGIFATVLDTRHIDLDVALQVRGGGAHFNAFSLSPGFEVNFDADPDMKTWGLYLRGALPLCSRETFSGDHPSRTHFFDDAHAEITLGAYLTLAKGHQILIEHDLEFVFQPGDDTNTVGVGGLAFGYNVVVTSTLELVTQVYLDIPQADERVTFGLTVGFILTALPDA